MDYIESARDFRRMLRPARRSYILPFLVGLIIIASIFIFGFEMGMRYAVFVG
jgi:hypothetical protein